MIVHVDPGSPWWIQGAAASVLTLHIGGGVVGLASGTVAAVAPKGGRVHRTAGNVFFVAMLTMAAMASVASPFMSSVPQQANLVGGVFTFYLVATAWMTVRRPEGQLGRFEVWAMPAVPAAVALSVWFGWRIAHLPASALHGQAPPQATLFVGIVAAFAAGGDIHLVVRKGLTGAQRLARHLWRMCVALFFAAGSFFLGQQQLLPAFARGSPLLFLPALAPLALMVFWLVRVRMPAASTQAAPAGAAS